MMPEHDEVAVSVADPVPDPDIVVGRHFGAHQEAVPAVGDPALSPPGRP